MKILLFVAFGLFGATFHVAANEQDHVVSISPDKKYEIVVENRKSPGPPEKEPKAYLTELPSRKRLNFLDDVDGEISAVWNKQSDGVIVFYHYGRISGSTTLKAKHNRLGQRVTPFSKVQYPDMKKSLPPDADPGTGRWYFSDAGWTKDGDLVVEARIGNAKGEPHIDEDEGGYDLHLRIDRDNKAKVIKVIQIKAVGE